MRTERARHVFAVLAPPSRPRARVCHTRHPRARGDTCLYWPWVDDDSFGTDRGRRKLSLYYRNTTRGPKGHVGHFWHVRAISKVYIGGGKNVKKTGEKISTTRYITHPFISGIAHFLLGRQRPLARFALRRQAWPAPPLTPPKTPHLSSTTGKK